MRFSSTRQVRSKSATWAALSLLERRAIAVTVFGNRDNTNKSVPDMQGLNTRLSKPPRIFKCCPAGQHLNMLLVFMCTEPAGGEAWVKVSLYLSLNRLFDL